MADQDLPNDDQLRDREAAEGVAPGSFGEKDERLFRQGGINQELPEAVEAMTDEQRIEYEKRRNRSNAVDDNAASHQGGMGAQGGQADFGSQGNLAGGFDTRSPNP